jgi:hypothetical protein
MGNNDHLVILNKGVKAWNKRRDGIRIWGRISKGGIFMDAERIGLVDSDKMPTRRQVASWIGSDNYALWKRVTQYIEKSYPDVFAPEWIFGGKKYGWGLRYKKGAVSKRHHS